MITFSVEFPNIEKVIGAVDKFGSDIESAVWAGLQRTAFEVKDFAVEHVHKITGDLSRSIQITDEDRRNLSIVISTNLDYAAVEEFGFQGAQIVGQHSRTIRKAFGRPIPVTTVFVRGHTRFVDRDPHPYMGPAADYGNERILPNIEAEINAVRR